MAVLRNKYLPIVVAVLAVASIIGVVLAQNKPGGHDRPRYNAKGQWIYHFNNMGEMVATSDLVAIGTVKGVTRGRILPGNSEVKQQLKNINVQVDEVLSGDLTTSSIVVETAGWEISDATGEGEQEIILAETAQLQAGDQATLFLAPYAAASHYSFLNNQALFKLQGNEVADTERSDPFVRDIERLNTAQLKEKIKEAKEAVARGEVKPKSPNTP
jgi:hypothetical protein